MGLDAWLAGWPAWEVAGSLGEQAEFVVNPGKFAICCTFHRKAKVAIRRKAKVFFDPELYPETSFFEPAAASKASHPTKQPTK